jgi:multiple antibiotic resistance protein
MVGQLVRDFLLICVPLFVVLDPAGNVPLYLALTRNQTEIRRREIARRATIVAAMVGVAFVIVGQAIFTMLGVRFADFQIAGGILLVILAVVDLLLPGKPAVSEKQIEAAAENPGDTIAVVPLAVPLIVGPATMTTSLLLVSTYSPRYAAADMLGPNWGSVVVIAMVCLALVLNLFVLYLAMYHSAFIRRVVGQTTLEVVNKIVMILLAAIAVSLIRQGVTSIVMDLRK